MMAMIIIEIRKREAGVHDDDEVNHRLSSYFDLPLS